MRVNSAFIASKMALGVLFAGAAGITTRVEEARPGLSHHHPRDSGGRHRQKERLAAKRTAARKQARASRRTNLRTN